MADQIARARDIRQLREDVVNARECQDDTVEVPTGALEAALAEIDRLNERVERDGQTIRNQALIIAKRDTENAELHEAVELATAQLAEAGLL